MSYGHNGAARDFHSHVGLIAEPLARHHFALERSFAHMQRMGTNADGDPLLLQQHATHRSGEFACGKGKGNTAINCKADSFRVGPNTSVEHIHRRLTNKSSGEKISRAGLQFGRCSILLQHTAFHHSDAVGKRVGLRLIMGDKNGGALVLAQIMLDTAPKDGAQLRFELAHGFVKQVESGLAHEGAAKTLECDIVAGCDGFHGICRTAIPENLLTVYDRIFPFGWLGILAETKPFPEMSYSNHERGFALASRRSPKLSRLYVQCSADEDLAGWPDRRIWDELHTRLYDKDGGELHEGPIVQRGVTPVRSYVAAPMRHGRMFLAGDAVHIVPPTGAKGLNLAVADVRVLSRALIEFFRTGATDPGVG